jgi:ABC-2 type transport system permease protein
MFYRILTLVHKELIHFRRDRLLTPFIIFGPVFQLFMLASATGSEMRNLPVGILDLDHSAMSRAVVQAFSNASQLRVRADLQSIEQAIYLIDDNQLDMVVVIPQGFAGDVLSLHRRPALQLILDGSNALVAKTLQHTAQGILTQFQRQQAKEMGLPAGGSAGIDLRTTARFNPTLNMRYSTLPAQLGLIVYMVTMLVASLGITRERERGTMEQLAVTPIRRTELLAGKAVPVLIIALTDFMLMLLVVTRVYQVPMRGSLALLLGLTALYISAEMGMGLIISSVAHSQQQSLLLVFLIGVLNVAFSGYLVPTENLPLLLKQASYLFPLQHYMTLLRQVMLKGAALADVLPDAGAILLLGTVIAGVAYSVVQRRLD